MKRYMCFILFCSVFLVLLTFNSIAEPVTNCADFSDIDCLYNYVRKTGDGSVCENESVLKISLDRSDFSGRDLCYFLAGKASKNVTYCKKIQSKTLGLFPGHTCMQMEGYCHDPAEIYSYINVNSKTSCFLGTEPQLNKFWIRYYILNFLFLLLVLAVPIMIFYPLYKGRSKTRSSMKELLICFFFSITFLYIIYSLTLKIIDVESFVEWGIGILYIFLVMVSFTSIFIKKVHIHLMSSIFSLKDKLKKLLIKRYNHLVFPSVIVMGSLSFVCLWIITSLLAAYYTEFGANEIFETIALMMIPFSLVFILIIGGIILYISQFLELKNIIKGDTRIMLIKSTYSFIILCITFFVSILILLGIILVGLVGYGISHMTSG